MPGNSGCSALKLADQILAEFVFDAAADQFGLGKGTGAKRTEGMGQILRELGQVIPPLSGYGSRRCAGDACDGSSDTMDNVGTQTETNPPGVRARLSELTADVQRGFVAEWAVTIILLLFGTTTLVQAFVIPSASMVGTLLIGDHVLVDKLVYAPPGSIRQGAALPGAAARRHHRVPLSAEHLDGLREARDRGPGRSHPAGEPATDAERPPGERALRSPQPDSTRTRTATISRRMRTRYRCARGRRR